MTSIESSPAHYHMEPEAVPVVTREMIRPLPQDWKPAHAFSGNNDLHIKTMVHSRRFWQEGAQAKGDSYLNTSARVREVYKNVFAQKAYVFPEIAGDEFEEYVGRYVRKDTPIPKIDLFKAARIAEDAFGHMKQEPAVEKEIMKLLSKDPNDLGAIMGACDTFELLQSHLKAQEQMRALQEVTVSVPAAA